MLTTSVILLGLFSQCGSNGCGPSPQSKTFAPANQMYYDGHVIPHPLTRPMFYLLIPRSPWNQAVDDLRRSQAIRRANRHLSPVTSANLQQLQNQKDMLWDELVTAEKEDKAEIREDYRIVKAMLEKARIRAARELR